MHVWSTCIGVSGVISGLYVCLKCHGKKKRTAYLDICDQKKVLIYSKIEIISGEYKLINKYSYSRVIMRKDLRYRSHYLYILPL